MFDKQLTKKTILITGGSGFVASNLKSYLESQGYIVLLTSRSKHKTENQFNLRQLNKDFKSEDFLKILIEVNPVAIIHCAGRINGKQEELFEANQEYTLKVISSTESFNKNVCFIFISSVSAINPVDSYGQSKHECEEMIRKSLLNNWIILQPSLIYGFGDNKNIQTLVKLTKNLFVIPVPVSKNIKLQPLFIEDLSILIHKIILNANIVKSTLVVSGPEQLSIWQIISEIIHAMNTFRLCIPIPFTPIKKILMFIHYLFPFLPLPLQQIKNLDSQSYWNFSDAQRSFNFQPTYFRDGIQKILLSKKTIIKRN